MKNTLIVMLVLLLVWPPKAQAERVSPPNIIFVKTDDQRLDSLSMTGHPVTQTPHIDRLAAEGVFFSQAVITSPICGPSRANFFTGQWERKNRNGFHHVSKNPIPRTVFDQSWQMRLKAAGYFNGYIGKHHAQIGPKPEANRYMKENIDFCYMRPGHLGFDLMKHRAFQNLAQSTQIEGLYEATEAFMRTDDGQAYFFDNAHQSVADFLHRRDASRPFSLSINFNLPHAASIGGMGVDPSHPEIYRTLYNDQREAFAFPQGYPNIDVQLPPEVFAHNDLERYYHVDKPKKLLNKKIKMARAVTGIDRFVGRLREQLEAMGVADNTIIVFASDHGLLLGEHGLGGKTFLYEETLRIPLIVYSPRFEEQTRGQVLEHLVVGQDVPATILELCGQAVPDTYQGQSMLPLIQGRPVCWRQDVFCENLFTDQNYPRMEAVRSKDWKYIRYFSRSDDRKRYLPDASINGEAPVFEELFHLADDPKEQMNLAGDPAHADTLEQHRQRCQALVTQMSK